MGEYLDTYISEDNFLKLLFSTIVIQEHNLIIEMDELEKNLYNFYYNSEFDLLFKNINIKNDNCIDLNNAYNTALNSELLICIHNKSYILTFINLSINEANEIIQQFKTNEINAMEKLCRNLYLQENKNTGLVLKRIFK
jgi:hypothetical protein